MRSPSARSRGLLVVKLAVWATALGSNTSGGILAPLLMLGAALGGLLGGVLPGAGEGMWALMGMAGAMAGVMRSPCEHRVRARAHPRHGVLLPLLAACTIAHLISVLTLRRSILTEKIARRGYHVTREYEVDPLHALLVRDVMPTDVLTVAPVSTVAALYEQLPEGSDLRRQRLYPVLEATGPPWSARLLRLAPRRTAHLRRRHGTQPTLARLGETLREIADRMVATGHAVLPVIRPRSPRGCSDASASSTCSSARAPADRGAPPRASPAPPQPDQEPRRQRAMREPAP